MLTMFSYFSWAILGVLYFLFFSAKIPDLGQGGIEIRAGWYVIGTNIFEAVAYLVASLLCWRNWQSTQMVSSRKVWLSIGLGMFAYFIGRLVFAYIEIGLKQQPDVSIANVFFYHGIFMSDYWHGFRPAFSPNPPKTMAVANCSSSWRIRQFSNLVDVSKTSINRTGSLFSQLILHG